MNSYRTTAKLTGIFFIISDVASIIALLLYQPLLNNADYITSANVNDARILVGAFLEILLAISVAGTAITLYPLLKKQNHGMALGYVIARAAEATVILVGIMSILSVLTLRQDFLPLNADPSIYQAIGKAFVVFHNWTFLFGPNIVLGLNATLLGYLLYKSKLVPRTISLVALVDGPIIFASGTAILFGLYQQISPLAIIIAMPMLLFEVSLALWLIIKGFNSSAVAFLESKKQNRSNIV